MPFFLIPQSFGDILAAADLVLKIYKALKDSTGASYEYQCLMQELESFHAALLVIDATISVIHPQENIQRRIKDEVSACVKLLDAFHDSIKGYRKKLNNSSWRKIGWSLFKPQDIAELRQKLSQHKHNITFYMNSIGICQATDIQTTLITIQTQLKEISIVQKELPRSIGYSHENSVTLTDALGKSMSLPLEHCFTPEMLHNFLLLHFRQKSGYDYVLQNQYVISANVGRSVVKADPDRWSSVVKKGAALVMSITLAACEDAEATQDLKTCQKCGETAAGVMEDDGWFECRRCSRRFLWENSKSITILARFSRKNDIADFRHILVVALRTALNKRISHTEWDMFSQEQQRRIAAVYNSRWQSAPDPEACRSNGVLRIDCLDGEKSDC